MENIHRQTMTNVKSVVNPDYAHIADYINNIPSVFDTEGMLVYSGRNIVRRLTSPDGTPLIVKRFKFPNPIQRIAYSFYRPSKAKRAYEYGLKLLEMGFDTPCPIAYMETRNKCLFSHGYFVSTVDDRPDCTILRTDRHFDNDRLANDLMEFFTHLHDKGVLHGDTNLSNFLYEKKGDKYHFSIIDTNRSKFITPPVTKDQCLTNLVRLTHVTDLLHQLVTTYANLRGWDAQQATTQVATMLKNFEQRRKVKHSLRFWKHTS